MSTLIRDMNGSDEKDAKTIALLKHFQENWKDPAINVEFHAFAREITRQVMETYQYQDITPLILESTTIPRDTHYIRFNNLQTGYTATTVSAGGRRNQFRLDKSFTEIKVPDEYENATIELYEDDIREGNYGTVANIRDGIREALLQKKFARVMEELHRVCNSTQDISAYDNTATAVGNSNYIYNPGSTLRKSALDFALRTVIARTGKVVSIVGAAEYLLQIADFAGFLSIEATDGQKEQLQSRGWVGHYRGANIVTVPEYRTAKYNKLVWDPHNIYIIGAGMAEVATLFNIEAVSDFEPMRSVRLIGADQKYVVLSQDPQLKRGFRIQMQ